MQEMKSNFNQIPDELKERPQWLLWKVKKRDGKPTKVPYNAKNGQHASTTDPGTWSDFKKTVKTYKKNSDFHGIGYVFSDDDPYTGIDLDDVVESGTITVEAKEIIDELDSYTEYSPSGDGFHILVKGDKKLDKKCTDLNTEGTHIEIYDHARYFTVTGNVFDERDTIKSRGRELHDLEEKYLKSSSSCDNDQCDQWQKVNSDSIEELHEKAKNAENGQKYMDLFKGKWQKEKYDYPSQSEADEALMNILAYWTQKDREQMEKWFSKSELGKRDKWKDTEDYRDRTIRKAIDYTDEEYNPESDSEDDMEEIIGTTIKKDDFLAEEITTDDGFKFAYIDDGDIKIKENIVMDGKRYIVDETDNVKDTDENDATVTLPPKPKEYESTKKLLEEIQSLIHDYVDVSDDYETIASMYVLLSWLYERVYVVPYLRAYGDHGTGKSRLLDVLGAICYKPVNVTEASGATLFRLIDKYKGTLIWDEADFKHSNAENPKSKILNAGYKKGGSIPRCNMDKLGTSYDDIDNFNVYCPKLLGTRYKFRDKAIESRCFTETMTVTQREEILKKTRLAGKFEKRAEELRAKLLMFRLQRYHEITVKEDVNYDIPDNVEGRVREIAEGFFDIIEHSDLRDKIRNFLSDHQEDIVEERSNSEEGMILYIIYKNWINNGKEPVDLWSGKISDEIEGYYDIELKPEQIGRLLKTLDIDTKLKTVWIDVNEDKEKSRKRCIIWNMDKLKNKFDRYVPEFEREDSNNSEDDNSNLDDFDKNDNDQTLMENIRDTMINEGKKEIPQNTIIDSVPGETKEITNMIQKMINKGYITDKGCGIYSLNTK